MKKIRVVFLKEVKDNLRDYRSWATGLFWALFGPVSMGLMMVLLGSSLLKNIDKPLRLPVLHPENAPGLIQFLEQHDVVIESSPANPQAYVKEGEASVILVIGNEYAGNFSSSRPASLQLVMDSSRVMDQIDVLKIQTLLEQYGKYMGRLRLVTRGVSPDVMQAVLVEKVDVATPQSRMTFLVSFLPYFIVFAIFNGAAPIVTDTTAGERERLSLEPLLINPVPRRAFVLGKLAASFPFSIASLAITLVGFGLMFRLLSVDRLLGNQVELNGTTLVLIFLVCLPIVFLASAMQMVVASFVRSTKEASTYLPYIALVPSLAGLAVAFFPVKPALWTMLIPTFGQQILIHQLMRLETIRPAYAGIATLVTLLMAVLFTLLAIRLYNREGILIRKN